MYCSFYGFREKPFTLTPNPRFIFLSKNHREAFAHLLYGIDNQAGFITLTGEVGTGKTTVLRTLLSQLDENGHRTALIFNPCLSAPELLTHINREFGLQSDGLSTGKLLDDLNHFLIGENSAGRTVTLIIDESQNLTPQVLEQIRLISNLETKTDKLIQIVLAGQPELETLLEKPELRQLAQRITVRYHLQPLDFDDTKAYITHRLEKAGDLRPAIFTTSAQKRIFRATGGLPRLINIICDRCLLIGYAVETREISRKIAVQAIRETKVEGRYMGHNKRLWLATASLMALLATLGIYFGQHKPSPSYAISSHAITRTTLKSSPAPVHADTDFIEAMRLEMAENLKNTSALRAINVLAKLWRTPTAPTDIKTGQPDSLEQLSKQCGLHLTRVDGDLATLLRLDVPALLEFTLPGLKDKRYLTLTEQNNGKLSIAPTFLGKNSLSESELNKFWSGRAYIAWKDFSQIAASSTPNANAVEVLRLQIMLAGAGAYNLEPSGSYDKETIKAVSDFQKKHRVAQNGRADGTTLMILYRDSGKFAIPRLAKKKGS